MAGLPVLCLAHLHRILAARPDDVLARAFAERTAEALDRSAENMRRYALKHDAIRRNLLTHEERIAYLLGLARVARDKRLAPRWAEDILKVKDLFRGAWTKFNCNQSGAAKALRDIFDSGRPLTYVRSSEEERVAKVLREVGQRVFEGDPTSLWTWSVTEGMHRENEPAESGASSPREALAFIVAHKESAIFHLKDFHQPLRDSPELTRRIRDLYQSCFDQRKFVVISSPVRLIPDEIEREIAYLELPPRI